ncbi:hypothetical protein AC1031_021161 [Aphanomyces cochlioides]|nr:hypothetical protein AC1031_021161 [Aphanomyces cochlioides]
MTTHVAASDMHLRMGNPTTPSSWRARLSMEKRDAIQKNIMHVLIQLKPNAPSAVVQKLPSMSKRLEESLLLMARSEDEYLNDATLQQRIMDLQQKNASKLLKRPSPSASQRGPRLTDDQRKKFFVYLQAWRNKTVQDEGIGPWDIMPTHILAQVATVVPTDFHQLEQACGVDPKWIEKYGESFMRHIEHCLKHLQAKTRTSEQEPEEKRLKVSKPSPASPSKASRVTPIAPAKPVAAPAPTPPLFTNLPTPSYIVANVSPSPMYDNEGSVHGLTSILRPQSTPKGAAALLPRLNDSVLPTVEAYEEELNRLRMMLTRSQQENAVLSAEVQYLRQQLRQSNDAAAAAAACEALVACQTANVKEKKR